MSTFATVNALHKPIPTMHDHQLSSTTATVSISRRRSSSFPSSKWGFRANCVRASANRKSKLKRGNGKAKDRGLQLDKIPSGTDGAEDMVGETLQSSDIADEPLKTDLVLSSTRKDVLKACVVTCGVILALGMAIRQVSHVGFMEGWPIHDCSAEVSFSFEIRQLWLIVCLVLVISPCRYVLLNTWPDFANSSEVSNTQVLGPLTPSDYLFVAFLPGISEEILFRGALLPLLGLRWESVMAVSAIFGVLHLGSGRKYSFAVWATFVGMCYGFSTIASSSVIVPIAAHSLNNLAGALLWRFTAKLEKKD